jgi:hypothetical protein
VRLVKVLFLEKPRSFGEDAFAYPFSYRVIHAVAYDGRREDRDAEPENIKRTYGRKCPGREEKRVAWQKGRYHEACLAKYYCEQYRVRPHPAILYYHIEVPVNMKEKFHDILYNFHPAPVPLFALLFFI